MTIFDDFVAKYGRLPTEFDFDYLEMLRMSKYVILDVPMNMPGKCANCGASKDDGRKYIDFGLYVDWYGTVFLCGICLTEVASKMGLFKALEDKIKELTDKQIKLVGLDAKADVLETKIIAVVEEVKEYFEGLHALGSSASSDSSPSVDPGEESSEQNITSSQRGIASTKPGTTQSATGSRRKDLSSLTELLNS